MTLEEQPLEPELPIIDPHHHLWDDPPPWNGLTSFPIELLTAARAESGHNIQLTMFIDCRYSYLDSGPEELRPIGETQTVEKIARRAEAGGPAMQGLVAGIVGHANMLLGDQVEPVLLAHMEQSRRFRGIRHATPYHPGVTLLGLEGQPELLRRAEFLRGLSCLTKLGLTFDAYVYYPQLPDVAFLARAIPEATIILDHIGAPDSIPGVARDAAQQCWRTGLEEVARCENVVVKVGGLLMEHRGAQPLPSHRAAELIRDKVLIAIDLFGPQRCMFESNFPVDGAAISYGALWNTFKRLSEHFSHDERLDLFQRTAARVYKLDY